MASFELLSAYSGYALPEICKSSIYLYSSFICVTTAASEGGGGFILSHNSRSQSIIREVKGRTQDRNLKAGLYTTLPLTKEVTA